jgi:hypothetical protein
MLVVLSSPAMAEPLGLPLWVCSPWGRLPLLEQLDWVEI